MTAANYPTAHMTIADGAVMAEAVDATVVLSYQMSDYWRLLTIYLTPEQALTLASQLRSAATDVEEMS